MLVFGVDIPLVEVLFTVAVLIIIILVEVVIMLFIFMKQMNKIKNVTTSLENLYHLSSHARREEIERKSRGIIENSEMIGSKTK